MRSRYVLVLGSKPKSKLPKHPFNKIYTANGAAIRSKKYINKHQLICVSSVNNFERNEDVKKRVINSNPNRLIVRFGKIKIPFSLKKNCKVEFINSSEQLNFQKKFFLFGNLSVFFAELFYKDKMISKLKKIFNYFRKKNFQGVSTGFFAILFALKENPKSKIVVSGIGLSGGNHFYQSKRPSKYNYDSRSAVDRFLIKLLLKKYKKNIFSLDNDFVKISKTNKWNGGYF